MTLWRAWEFSCEMTRVTSAFLSLCCLSWQGTNDGILWQTTTWTPCHHLPKEQELAKEKPRQTLNVFRFLLTKEWLRVHTLTMVHRQRTVSKVSRIKAPLNANLLIGLFRKYNPLGLHRSISNDSEYAPVLV